jgi:hypothetical protein
MAKSFSFGGQGKAQKDRLAEANKESDALWVSHKGLTLEEWPKNDLVRLIECTRIVADVRAKQSEMASQACDEMQLIVDAGKGAGNV